MKKKINSDLLIIMKEIEKEKIIGQELLLEEKEAQKKKEIVI